MKEVLGVELVVDDKNFSVNLKRGGEALRQINRSMTRTVDGTREVESAFSRASRSFRQTTATVAALRYSLRDITDAFISLPGAVMSTYGRFERLNKMLEGLSKQTGAAERVKEAADNVDYLINMAKTAPFNIDALSDAFVKLKTGGVDPLNGSLQALVDGNARFGGNSETLKRAAVAIQQMGGKGVVSMEELRQQLGEAVPTAMKNMAQGVGLSMADLAKQVSLGAVEAQEAMKRMFTVMGFENRGAAKTLMETWNGVQARLQTSWDLLVNDLGKSGFAKEVEKQLQGLTEFLDSSEAKKMAANFGNLLGSITHGLAESAKFLAQNIDLVKGLALAYGALKAGQKISRFGGAVGGSIFGIADAKKSAEQNKEIQENSLKNAIRLKKQEVEQTRNMNLQAAIQRRADAARELAEQEAYLRTKLGQQEKYAREVDALQAAHNRLRNMPNMGAGNVLFPSTVAVGKNLREKQAKLRSIDSEVSKNKALTAAAANLVRQETLNVASQQRLAKVTGLTTLKIAAQTTAMRAGGAILGLMGGWVGALTTLLTLGAMAWAKWGNSGKQAIKEVQDAINTGTATSETVKKIDSQIADAEDEEGYARAALKNLQNNELLKAQIAAGGEIGKQAQDQIDAAKANLEAAKEVTNALRDQKTKALKQAEENDGITAVSAQARDIQRIRRENTVKAISAQNKLEAEAAEKIKDIKEKKEKGWAEEAKKIEKQLIQDKKKLQVDAEQASFDVIKTNADAAMAHYEDLKKAGVASQEELNIAKQKAEEYQIALAEAGNALKDAKDIVPEMDIGGGKPDKKSLKLAKDIDGVRAKIKNLQEQASEAGKGLMEQLVNPQAASLAGTELEHVRKQIVRLKQEMVAKGGSAQEVINKTKGFASQAALRDLAEMAVGMRDQTREINISLLNSDKDRIKASYDYEMQTMRAKYDALLEFARQSENSAEDIKLIEKEKADFILATQAKLARDLETPLQSMTREWRENYFEATDKMMADWAEGSIDTIAEFTETGKFKWREMLTSWLQDLNRMVLQKTLSKPFESMFDGIGEGIKGLLNFGAGAAPTAIVGMSGIKAVQGASPDALVTSINTLAPSLSGLTDDVTRLSQEGIAQMASSTAKGISQQVAMTAAQGTATSSTYSSFTTLAAAAQMATQALMNLAASQGASQITGLLSSLTTGVSGGIAGLGSPGGASLGDSLGSMGDFTPIGPKFTFANGGIMTEFGPVALRKYAKGGIAKSPQLALYGEGSQNEAYVPLPDGRTIPVTMSGNNSNAVTPVHIEINVTQNGDGQSNEKQSSSDANSQWKPIADKVRGIVLDELVKQRRTGGMLRQ